MRPITAARLWLHRLIFLTISQEIWHTLPVGRDGWKIRERTVSETADKICSGTGRDSDCCCAASIIHWMDWI